MNIVSKDISAAIVEAGDKVLECVLNSGGRLVVVVQGIDISLNDRVPQSSQSVESVLVIAEVSGTGLARARI